VIRAVTHASCVPESVIIDQTVLLDAMLESLKAACDAKRHTVDCFAQMRNLVP